MRRTERRRALTMGAGFPLILVGCAECWTRPRHRTGPSTPHAQVDFSGLAATRQLGADRGRAPAEGALDSDRIAVFAQGSVDRLANVAWSDRATAMLQLLIVQASRLPGGCRRSRPTATIYPDATCSSRRSTPSRSSRKARTMPPTLGCMPDCCGCPQGTSRGPSSSRAACWRPNPRIPLPSPPSTRRWPGCSRIWSPGRSVGAGADAGGQAAAVVGSIVRLTS